MLETKELRELFQVSLPSLVTYPMAHATCCYMFFCNRDSNFLCRQSMWMWTMPRACSGHWLGLWSLCVLWRVSCDSCKLRLLAQRLLDMDETGTLSPQELVDGWFRLRGPAKARLDSFHIWHVHLYHWIIMISTISYHIKDQIHHISTLDFGRIRRL